MYDLSGQKCEGGEKYALIEQDKKKYGAIKGFITDRDISEIEETIVKIDNELASKLKEPVAVECAPEENSKLFGRLKFPTLDFAFEVFKTIRVTLVNSFLGQSVRGNIDFKVGEVAKELEDVKKAFYVACKDYAGESDQALKLFNELDKTLNIQSINYDLKGIDALRKDIEKEIERIYHACGFGGAGKDIPPELLRACTNWHLGLFAIGAQHYACTSTDDSSLKERRTEIINHLMRADWWDGATEKTPKTLEGSNGKITAFITPEGNKKLQIPTANELKDSNDITLVIRRVIDELSNAETINWKSVAPGSDFERQAEFMSLAKWKHAEFNGVESEFSASMPPEKGNWSGWVDKLNNLNNPNGEIHLKQLVGKVVGKNKDTLMEFLSDIVSKDDTRDKNLEVVIKLLDEDQQKLIVELYTDLTKKESNLPEHLKAKASHEICILREKAKDMPLGKDLNKLEIPLKEEQKNQQFKYQQGK